MDSDIFTAITASDVAALRSLLIQASNAGVASRRIEMNGESAHWKDVIKMMRTVELSFTLNSLKQYVFSYLHLACFATNPSVEVVELLIEFGAFPSALDSLERPPVGYACKKGCLGVVQRLAARGADLHAKMEQGQTSLHRAADSAAVAMVTCLLDCGADANALDKNGVSPLMLAGKTSGKFRTEPAADSNELEIARLLIQRGADVKAVDCSGWTCAHYACGNRTAAILELLLHMGADIESPDNQNKTLLFMACESNSLSNVQLLLERGANAKATTTDGRICLHIAPASCPAQMVQLLVDGGADANAVDAMGQPVLMRWCSTKRLDVLQLPGGARRECERRRRVRSNGVARGLRGGLGRDRPVPAGERCGR